MKHLMQQLTGRGAELLKTPSLNKTILSKHRFENESFCPTACCYRRPLEVMKKLFSSFHCRSTSIIVPITIVQERYPHQNLNYLALLIPLQFSNKDALNYASQPSFYLHQTLHRHHRHFPWPPPLLSFSKTPLTTSSQQLIYYCHLQLQKHLPLP